jgi:hypothetical protein
MFKLLFAFIVFIIAQVLPIDSLVTWLTPVIVYGVTWAVAKLKPLIPGWLILTIVAGLGGLYTLVTQLFGNPELKWWQQLLYALLAVVISQFKIQFGGEKRAEDTKAITDDKKLNG